MLTELGDVESIIIDDLDLTGTVPTGVVEELTKGIFPPFDSLDPENGLPLGSSTITDLSDLSMVVAMLRHLGPLVTSTRMVAEYDERFYRPLGRR